MMLITAFLLFNKALSDNGNFTAGVTTGFHVWANVNHDCPKLREVTAFNEAYLTKLCPDVGNYKTDRTVTAKICPGSRDPITGKKWDSHKNSFVKANRERSLKLAIVNQMYGKSMDNPYCDSFCMYDPVNVGSPLSLKRVGFIWRNKKTKKCWDLVSDFACYGKFKDEWEHAKKKIEMIHSCPGSDTADTAETALEMLNRWWEEMDVTGVDDIALPITRQKLLELYDVTQNTRIELWFLEKRVRALLY